MNLTEKAELVIIFSNVIQKIQKYEDDYFVKKLILDLTDIQRDILEEMNTKDE